jgi:glycogen(starch) synthase
MRVFVLSNYYPPYYQGGYELNCRKVVDELRRRQHWVLVVTSDWQAEKGAVQDFVQRLLHIRSFKGIGGLRRRTYQFHQIVTGFQDYLTMKRLGQVFQPDVAYIWNMSGLSLTLLMALQRLNVPMVFDLGDYWLLRRWAEFSEESSRLKRWYRSAIQGGFRFEHLDLDHLLADSHVLKQQYVENGFPAETITVIPRGLSPQYIAEEPAPLDYGCEIRLLYVGRLTEAKGAHVAIETLANLVQGRQLETVQLDIVGNSEADYARRLRQMVVSLGLEANVFFRGHLPHRELMASYHQYHALLFPAIWIEPFGGAVMEAMAQGLCVIASDVGGHTEHIRHGESGLLVPRGDPRAMAQAVMALIESPDHTQKMRKAAIETVRSRYVFDKIADRIEAYLQAVIGKNSKESLPI